MEARKGLPDLAHREKFTYGQYLTWPDEERWELIEGVRYDMNTAPRGRHQGLLVELGGQLATFLRGKTCRVFVASYDVRLPEVGESDEETTTVVQPNIVVICDGKKLGRRGCKGAPDLVLEILSPQTAAKDQGVKARLYEKHGVREYWVLHPTDAVLMTRALGADGAFGSMGVMDAKGLVAVKVLPGLEVNFDAVWEAAEGSEGEKGEADLQ